MGLGTDQFTSTDLQYHIPEVWSGRMNDFYRQALKAGEFFTDLSDAFTSGGDTLNIPSLSEMTANAKSNGNEVTLNSPSEGQVQLVVNQWYEVSFLIEDKEAVQVLNSYDLQERYAKNAAYTVGSALEDAIIALFDNFTQTAGTSAAGVADSDVRTAIRYLDAANAPREDRAFFMSAKAVWTDLMAIDKFTLVANTGGADPVLKGQVGFLYGIPVILHNDIGTTDGSAQNCLAHKDAIIHASSLMRIQANYIPQHLGTLVTADILYGVIENRDTSGVWIKTAAS
jgi:N4-gp56 family major capsid protein|tara:strand:- start:824 stop:1675 length:852 start_codon:yes stop_codon:yes gene_type:complete